MVKVRIDLVRDDGLAAAPEEPAPASAADEVEAPEALKKRGDAAFRRGEAAAAARHTMPPPANGVSLSRTPLSVVTL